MAHPFYANLAADTAERIEGLARLSFELKHNRATLLERYGVTDEEALLDRLRAGGIAEHPAYDHYLSARILHRMREAVRAELSSLMQGQAHQAGGDGPAPAMSLHLELKEELAARYGDRLTGEAELRQDALLARLDNGVALEVRYASPEEYGFHWVWGEAEMRIDTAPVHGALGTGPHHLHDSEGSVLAAPLTVPGRPPRENLRAVLDAVLEDPLLAQTAAPGKGGVTVNVAPATPQTPSPSGRGPG